MRTIAIVFCFIALSTSVSAQSKDNGKIVGKIIDSSNNLPVDYATVSIFKQGNPSPFNGAITGTKGGFTLSNLPNGDYRLTIDFIGYQKKIIPHVVVGGAKEKVELGNIMLDPAHTQLANVNITAKRPTIENQIDKMVYNPANDLTAQGGTALDVLQKVPMISVDIDGNVEMEGNSDIRFLINGKPSSIFGASLSDALQSIPASQIKDIEVITSPGAKYDASGTGGIINIVLKNNNVQGVNGNVNLSGGTRFENGSFNINAKKGNLGVNAYFSGDERLNSITTNSTNRRSLDSLNDVTNLLQSGSSGIKRSGYQGGFGFDWNISKKDEITGSLGLHHFGFSGSGYTNQQEVTTDPMGATIADLLSLRNSTSDFTANSSDYSLAYKKTFDKKDEELDFLYTSSLGNNTSNFSQLQNYLVGGYPSSGLTSNNPGKDRETDISIDYTNPFSKSFTLETGAKTVIENINNSVVTDTLLNDGDYVLNQDQTYGFNYKRDIFAYYLSGTFSLFNDFIDGEAGVRYEYTRTTADFPGTHIPDYGIFAPSFVLRHKIDKTQSIKFSYTYRLQRPDYQSLNPFYNISDPHNISAGNPNLKPELGHNFEIGYNKTFDKGPDIFVSAFYHYNTDDLQSYTTFYSVLDVNGTEYPNVSLTEPFNLGSEKHLGANLYISLPVTGKLSLRSNNFFADRISSEPGLPTTRGFFYHLNLNASYDFGHDLAVEVFGNYRSSRRTIQGYSPSFAFYNIALRKQFMHKKASIGLTAANPFNAGIKQTTTTMGSNFNQVSTRDVPFRSFGITLSYRFGKLEFKKDNNDQELNDVPPQNSSQAPQQQPQPH